MSANFMHSLDVDVNVDVGVAHMAVRGQQLVKVHFHGFKDLDSTKGSVVNSHPFDCFNHQWGVYIYPGGASDANDGMVSIFLELLSGNEVTVYFGVTVKNNNGGIIQETKPSTSYTFLGKGRNRGWFNFVKRSVLLQPGNLNNGTLTFELLLKLDESKSQVNFVPTNPFAKQMLKMFLDKDTSDVLFEVSGQQFYAHRVVLKACAPELARLCDDTDETTPVTIPDVEPKVFHMLLRYVYGGEVEADWKMEAKQYLDAADKYDIPSLKVQAESWYVTYHDFTVDSAIGDLLYADGKRCPLLREAAMKFILKNAKEVIESTPFEDALDAKDIIKEIMLGMAAANSSDVSEVKEDRVMLVNKLRMFLDEKGDDVDGCLEMLASRLEKYSDTSEKMYG